MPRGQTLLAVDCGVWDRRQVLPRSSTLDSKVATKLYTDGQILSVLEEADKGVSHVELCRIHGISAETLEGWLRRYSDPSQLRSALYRKYQQLRELQEVAGLGSWEFRPMETAVSVGLSSITLCHRYSLEAGLGFVHRT